MENKCFRASINGIPKDQSKLKSSVIPFFFNVDFQKEGVTAPIISEELIRCGKCKAYLNPYVEIVMPGFKWKCNLCETINETSTPFQMKERKICENVNDPYINSEFNKNYFLREELRNDVYELEVSDSFNISTPDIPVLCFIIDVSIESTRLSILSSVLNCIMEVFKGNNYNMRAKVAFLFFNESVYILNNNYTISVINGEIPLILSDKILFSVDQNDDNSIFNLKYEIIEKYFEDKKSDKSNYLLAVKAAIQAFRSASLFSFISTAPNHAISKVVPSSSLICKNKEYKNVAESLVKKNICSNLFIMARTSVEFSSLKMLSQFTGGQVYHYSNYDGSDAVSTSKFYCDLAEYFDRDIGFNAVCRIRANEGVVLKSAYGNFYQKGPDLLSYANFNPAHTINFTIQLFNELKNGLFIQVAMIRVTKSGQKLIRVVNFCIPIHPGDFYESCDSYAITHALALESFYHESKNKLSGNKFLKEQITSIWKEVTLKYGSVPENLKNLPILISSLMKGIPLRPDVSTPADFRGFYMYMLANTSIKVVDLIIYPLLINILEENVIPKPLSMTSIDPNGLYILDAGINLFFFIGKSCSQELVSSLFSDVKSGPFLFYPPENDMSKYVSELLVYLLSNRQVKPRFVLVNSNETSIYYDIFFSYMCDDRMHDLPSALEFFNSLVAK